MGFIKSFPENYFVEMNTHLRKLIAELRSDGWIYQATQTNGSSHFEHDQYGRIAVASTPADWEDECRYTRQRVRRAMRRFHARVPDVCPEIDQHKQTAEPELSSRLTDLWSELQRLHQECETLRAELPVMVSTLRHLLTDFYEQMVAQRQQLLRYLLQESQSPSRKMKEACALLRLGEVILQACENRLGVELNLEKQELQRFKKTVDLSESKADDENQTFVKAHKQTSFPDHFDQYSQEDWERWFELQETGEWIPAEARQKANRKKMKKEHPSDKMSEDIHKQLYRGLVRDFHPDKGVTDEEREERTTRMQHLNAAYASRDLQKMLHLMEKYDLRVEGLSDAVVEKVLREQKSRLEKDMHHMMSSLPSVSGNWRLMAKHPRTWKTFLRQEKKTAQQEVERMACLVTSLQTQKGLQSFLQHVDEDQWGDYF